MNCWLWFELWQFFVEVNFTKHTSLFSYVFSFLSRRTSETEKAPKSLRCNWMVFLGSKKKQNRKFKTILCLFSTPPLRPSPCDFGRPGRYLGTQLLLLFFKMYTKGLEMLLAAIKQCNTESRKEKLRTKAYVQSFFFFWQRNFPACDTKLFTFNFGWSLLANKKNAFSSSMGSQWYEPKPLKFLFLSTDASYSVLRNQLKCANKPFTKKLTKSGLGFAIYVPNVSDH